MIWRCVYAVLFRARDVNADADCECRWWRSLVPSSHRKDNQTRQWIYAWCPSRVQRLCRHSLKDARIQSWSKAIWFLPEVNRRDFVSVTCVYMISFRMDDVREEPMPPQSELLNAVCCTGRFERRAFMRNRSPKWKDVRWKQVSIKIVWNWLERGRWEDRFETK